MHYTYVLLSERDRRFYTGSTGDLDERVRWHNQGRGRSTANRAPLRVIYYEACIDPDDARRRERVLKTGKGKRYLKNWLAASLAGTWNDKSRSNLLDRDLLDRDKLERH